MSKKLKILHGMDCYLPDTDGVVNCMHNYCTHLSANNDVTAAVPKNKRGYKDNFPYTVVRSKSIFLLGNNVYYGIPKHDRKFKKRIMEGEYDIIHCHSPFNMPRYLLKVAKEKHIPIVSTFHSNMGSIFYDVVKSRRLTRRFERSLGKFYNQFDEVFTCSPLVEKQVRDYGYTGKVTYLPFGTDLPKRDDVEVLRSQANDELKLADDKMVFLYVGRVMHLKRIDFILRSLKILSDKGNDFVFYIVGKGAETKKLQKLVKKLELGDKVQFLGYVKRELLPLLFARADLFLFPSLYDNFALVKVEAAAYSTPCVLIKDSCAGYGVTDDVDGFLAENDERLFAEKIEEAISNPDKLREIGRNASNSLYITWKECTDKLYERYIEILDKWSAKNGN